MRLQPLTSLLRSFIIDLTLVGMRLTRLIIYIALLAAGGLHCPVGTRHYVKNGALQLIAFAIDVSLCRLSTCEYLARYSLYT